MTSDRRAVEGYSHRYYASDLLIAQRPPNPQFFAYSFLDRTWARAHVSQTVHRLQVHTVCSASAKVLVVISVAPISPRGVTWPDCLFNDPNDRSLVPFTTSMDKVIAIGACTYYDFSLIDPGRAIVIPAFHSLCTQVLFANPVIGQTARISITYSVK
jgi:hypothetical protein